MLRRLLAFRRWGDETAHLRAFAAALAWLLLVVTVENFATWAVAASDQHKYEYTPLQVGRGGVGGGSGWGSGRGSGWGWVGWGSG